MTKKKHLQVADYKDGIRNEMNKKMFTKMQWMQLIFFLWRRGGPCNIIILRLSFSQYLELLTCLKVTEDAESVYLCNYNHREGVKHVL